MRLCWVQSGSGGRTLVVNAPAAEALRDRVVAVFGSKAAEAMQPLQAAGPDGLQITGCGFITQPCISRVVTAVAAGRCIGCRCGGAAAGMHLRTICSHAGYRHT
jgi:hypothetical protein